MATNYLPRLVETVKKSSSDTVPKLPKLPDEFKFGGPWMDPQWKKDIRGYKKLFTAYPVQMAATLALTVGLALALALIPGGKAKNDADVITGDNVVTAGELIEDGVLTGEDIAPPEDLDLPDDFVSEEFTPPEEIEEIGEGEESFYGEEQVAAVAQAIDPTNFGYTGGVVDNCAVTYYTGYAYDIGTDKIVILTMNAANGTAKTASFNELFSYKAYQNGTELKDVTASIPDYATVLDTPIISGAGSAIVLQFGGASGSSPVTLELTSKGSGDKLSFECAISQ